MAHAPIIYQLRAYKVATAIVVGGTLSYAGLVLQNYFNNPLVCASTLGLSSIAGVGATLSIVLQLPEYIILALPIGFCIGYLILLKRIRNPFVVLFFGVFINFLGDSLVMWLKFLFASIEDYANIDFWFWGSLDKVHANNVYYLLIIAALLLWYLFNKSPFLDVLSQGFGFSQKLTTFQHRFRQDAYLTLFVIAVLVTLTTYLSGRIGFLGLLAPHITKILLPQHNYSQLGWASVFMGTNILLLANLLQLSFNQYGLQLTLPIGLILSLPGALFMLWFLYQHYLRQPRF